MNADLHTEPDVWTTLGFLDSFLSVHQDMQDRAFAFVLGAGASRPSGIPTGGELVQRWLAELHRRYDKQSQTRSVEAWTTTENIGIPGFQYASAESFYPQVFERRFGKDPDEGYAALEAVMADREPSIGYSILAQVLATTRHRVVITTNFDNLIADALSIYTRTYPFVCGHESLTSFVRARMRRPLIAKIHRDLLLGPKNDPGEVARLDPGWGNALRTLFQHYTPVIIGYGGNDGTLMGLLETLEPGNVSGGLFWCFRERDGLPGPRIQAVVSRHGGAFVPILGFDEFMLQLGEALKIGLLADVIERRAGERAKRYREQIEEIQATLSTALEDRHASAATEDVRKALAATIDRTTNWWSVELQARTEVAPERRAALYEAALDLQPNSPELLVCYARFLWVSGRSKRKARRLFERALKFDPRNSFVLNEYGIVLARSRAFDKAETILQRGLDLYGFPEFLAGLAAVFLEQHRNLEALEHAERAWMHRSIQTGSVYAAALLINGEVEHAGEVAFKALEHWKGVAHSSASRAFFIAAVIADQTQRVDVLQVLKALLEINFRRGLISHRVLLSHARDRLTKEELAFFTRLAEALDNPRSYKSLTTMREWQVVSAIPIWPERL